MVTGGAGFIGSNLVKYLLKKNYFVINIDKLSYSANPYNVRNLNKNKRVIRILILKVLLKNKYLLKSSKRDTIKYNVQTNILKYK